MRIQKTCIHPNWTGLSKEGFDIALLKLPYAVNIPVPYLPEEQTFLRPGTPLFVLGWGDAGEFGSNNGALQMSTDLVVVANKICPGFRNMAPQFICAHSKSQNTCKGEKYRILLMFLESEHSKLGHLATCVTFCECFSMDTYDLTVYEAKYKVRVPLGQNFLAILEQKLQRDVVTAQNFEKCFKLLQIITDWYVAYIYIKFNRDIYSTCQIDWFSVMIDLMF